MYMYRVHVQMVRLLSLTYVPIPSGPSRIRTGRNIGSAGEWDLRLEAESKAEAGAVALFLL